MVKHHHEYTLDEFMHSGESRQVGLWIAVFVDPIMPWPTTVQKIEFDGKTLFITPYFERDDYKCYPSISLFENNDVEPNEDDLAIKCNKSIMRFLSLLCWIKGKGVLVEGLGRGSRFQTMGGFEKSKYMCIDNYFKPLDFPKANYDDKLYRALAYYREGLSIQHHSYAFLSYYKVINCYHDKGKDQTKWIDSNIDKSVKFSSRNSLEVLRAKYQDLGEYLYSSCRCAVAHSFKDSDVVDPDNLVDIMKLRDALPLIKDLAAYMIKDKLKE